jgi:hypothetical protein
VGDSAQIARPRVGKFCGVCFNVGHNAARRKLVSVGMSASHPPAACISGNPMARHSIVAARCKLGSAVVMLAPKRARYTCRFSMTRCT